MWPDAIQCPVTLTFDLDGRTLPLIRDPEAEERISVLSMSDFGPRRGVWRILDLLEEHRIPASFFVPGYIAERYEDTVRKWSGAATRLVTMATCMSRPPR